MCRGSVRFVRRWLVVVGMLLAAGIPVSADVDLSQLLTRTNGALQWDTSLQFGLIRSGANVVAFKPGLEWAVLNNAELIRSGSVTRGPGGALLFSESGASAIASALKREESKKATESGPRPRIAAIIIDPGHGGKDPGTSHSHSINGKRMTVVEKEVVLEVAKELYGKLRARYPGKRILMTRSDDSYVSLEERTELANSIVLKENEAMIFVSVHANASFDPKADGFEVWYLPQNYRREVIDPGSLDAGSQDLYPILNSMREQEYTVESVLLGRKILSGVATAVGARVPDRGLKAESWFVVRKAKMPAVLVELGFITNEREASKLATPSYLKKLSEGIYNGVADFINYFDHLSGFME